MPRLASAVLPLCSQHPGQCGLFPLEKSLDAFAARYRLAEMAEHTLDVQYYIWQDDMSGRLLFIYLVHHPLTLFFGAYITPHITSNWLGFLCGLIFVVGIAIILYEIHLRIPLLKFLFSGKPVVKRENDKAPAR